MPHILFEKDEIAALLSAIAEMSEFDLNLSRAEEKLKAAQKPASKRDEQIVEIAESMSYVRSGEVEIDGDPIISEGDGNGAYVLGWVWADFADTALDKEREKEEGEADADADASEENEVGGQ